MAKKLVGEECSVCAKQTPVLHTSALVRALGVRLSWIEAGKPLAVCMDCYDVLATYRQIAFEERLKAEA